MRSSHNLRHPLYGKLMLALSVTFIFSSCYTVRVATQAQSGAEVSGATVNHFLWGLIQSPKRVTTPICDSLGANGMAEVTVKNNFGYSLITVATLGIWSPTRIEWKCSKPCQKVGNL
ncbi:MAG: hypothetical protein JWP37_418 [Mucilaginibacter sp.]|nr:hypothetical protein [Mucilaginibacter sp.]